MPRSSYFQVFSLQVFTARLGSIFGKEILRLYGNRKPGLNHELCLLQMVPLSMLGMGILVELHSDFYSFASCSKLIILHESLLLFGKLNHKSFLGPLLVFSNTSPQLPLPL